MAIKLAEVSAIVLRVVCPGELWGGVPARFIRKLTEDERAALSEEADDIRRIAWQHCAEELPHGTAWRGVEAVSLTTNSRLGQPSLANIVDRISATCILKAG